MNPEEFRFKDNRRAVMTGESWPGLDLSARPVMGRGPLPPGTVIESDAGDGKHYHGKIDVDGVTVIPATNADFKDVHREKTDLDRRKEIMKGNWALHTRRARDKSFGTIGDRLGELIEAAKTAREYWKLTGESII